MSVILYLIFIHTHPLRALYMTSSNLGSSITYSIPEEILENAEGKDNSFLITQNYHLLNIRITIQHSYKCRRLTKYWVIRIQSLYAYMQVRKQQLELDMEQKTGSK